jgi:hypothetical protein
MNWIGVGVLAALSVLFSSREVSACSSLESQIVGVFDEVGTIHSAKDFPLFHKF